MPAFLESIINQHESSSPQLWSNAPGRVNIIGEHTDHQYYGVLPTCINRSIKAVGSIETNADYVLKISNTNPKFETITFPTYESMVTKKGSWGTYALSAYTGLVEYMSNGFDKPDQSLITSLVDFRNGESCASIAHTSIIPKGLNILVASDLPAAAGVSSSSALVICFIRIILESILAGPIGAEFKSFYESTDFYKSAKIAEFSVLAERHCGTASGGMDQAIICLGNKNIALNIEFAPLTSTQVDLPLGMELIVANTGKISAKAEMAPFMYNKRVFELRLGNLLLLDAGLRLKSEKPSTYQTPADLSMPDYLPRLRDVERRLEMSFEELLELVNNNLSDEYTKEDILQIFSPDKLAELLKLSGADVLAKNSTFHLKQPIIHVLSETIRVHQFSTLCFKAKTEGEDPEITARNLGELMNESHYSLRDYFMNSCPELEALTIAAREAGAYGARMTGAGWGGCCVIAVDSKKAETVRAKLLTVYYIPTIEQQVSAGANALTALPTGENIDLELLQDTCFVAEPSDSAKSGHL